MRAIFISYRREDAEGQAGRLFNDLARYFGEDSVFMDVAGIEPGRDFRRVIDEHVASCGVLLAMIGKTWIDATDESGRRRLEDPMDFVRLETASALSGTFRSFQCSCTARACRGRNNYPRIWQSWHIATASS